MEKTSQISKSKIAAYEATDYKVDLESRPFTLMVGEISTDLKDIYEEFGQNCAAFVTACNPLGIQQSDAENEARNAQLFLHLGDISVLVIGGAGTDPTGAWPPEASYLALGLDEEAARKIGNRWRQDAVIWADADAMPRLLFLR
ncbi:MAG: DUF3293 domain-containing protein [Tateyamaria sp.]|uniref:DUF3293 domain-containing protein n=1 Tax=Tateyamaria sp. TaxID=1929288 RepID=UPI00329D02AB